ncbi:MAG: ketoacyl-ACP synthase III [Synergistes sp.]|nr:ketoacyl-ACP synthase III [Synergistes sp.]
MSDFRFHDISIEGIATAVPSQHVDVDSFKPRFGDEAVEKFKAATGIHGFCKALAGQTASDLGFAAAERLLEGKEINRDEIGILVFVTQSPDYGRPNTAGVLQKRLSLPQNCACFEVNLGCSGFIYGLEMTCAMLNASNSDNALLVLGETATKVTHPNDRSTAMLYGDSGAAVLLAKKKGAPEIICTLKSDGDRFDAIIVPAGGFRHPGMPHDSYIGRDGNERTLYDVCMDGTAVFTFTISDIPPAIKMFLADTGTSVEDYDCFSMHQANLFILKQLVKRAKIPADKMPVTIGRYGNTGAISVPLTLCDRYGTAGECGVIRVLGAGFGIGLSWGVTSFYVDKKAVMPVFSTDSCYDDGIMDKICVNSK